MRINFVLEHFKNMKVRSLFTIIISLLCLSYVNSQPLPKLKNDALELFNAGKYSQALVLLQNYYSRKDDDKQVIRALGIAAYNSNQLLLAQQMLINSAEDKKSDPSVWLYLGKTFHAVLDFKNAVKAYKEFLRRTKSDDPQRRVVVEEVKRCYSGIKVSGQAELALVENIGENVNSLHDEFGPIQSPNDDDKIYFSSARADSEGGVRNNEGLSDIKNGSYTADIYFTYFEGGDWISPVHLENSLINTARHDIVLDFANSGKTMYFFRGLTPYGGEILVDTFKTDNDIRSLPPQFRSPMNPTDGDNSLFFFNDTLLLFASRKAGGYGGLDLYYSVYSSGRWQPAKNLGSAINTPYDETTPYLARDGRTLYFSSNCTQSIGGFDIFKTTYNDDSLRFTGIHNLGKPINSAGDDTHFRLTNDGMKAYFCSNRRDGGFGERDIYTALFKSYQNEQDLSEPVAFHLVENFRAAQAATSDNSAMSKVTTLNVTPLFYDSDDDILRGENLRQLTRIAELIKQFPTIKVILLVNSNEGEKASFDLYFSMKRAEKTAKFLIDKGIRSDNLLIKSVGNSYPIAKAFLEGTPNPAGEKMNRRIDVRIENVTVEPIKVEYQAPEVSPFMVETAGEKINLHLNGLSYKVQIQTSKRLYDNELLARMADPMMEAVGVEGIYQYTVGLTKDYATAEKMRLELVKEGIKDAWVVPYIDGIRIVGDEAKRFANKYTDLQFYLASRKKP